MIATTLLKKKLMQGAYDDLLQHVYVTRDPTAQRQRLTGVVECYEQQFGATGEAALFSAPGRTELGGNHTDHQHGRVLAASVNLDIIACAAPNGTNIIRIQSEGYPMDTIALSDLQPQENEVNKTAALIRGVAAAAQQNGYSVSGFDAYMTSSVLSGSGLSSSAAYETMIGVIVNEFFCKSELSAIKIAKIGQYAENIYFGKPCGLMDQMASSVGSIVAIDFADEKNPQVEDIHFPFTDYGHSLCIINTGADHADLTDEYAAVPREMKAVAAYFGKQVLRDVPEEQFWAELPALRAQCGDRAVLRAAHFFAENDRAQREAQALKDGDFAAFLALVRESGQSSYMYLQNVYTCQSPSRQAVSVSLLLAEQLLHGRGAVRVHGGGFAGTIQAFVPYDMLNEFKQKMEAVLGEGSCHVLNIRPVGGTVLLA